MNSICQLVPDQEVPKAIETVYFVYENEFRKIKQPFCSPLCALHLVVHGSGTLTMGERHLPLEVGTLFFAFPGVSYTVEGSPDLAYMYIGFCGEGAAALLSRFGIDVERAVFNGFSHLIEFWQSCIRRVSAVNASILTESVLYYTLSFLHPDESELAAADPKASLFESLCTYIDNNFTSTDLSLKRIADIFSYTEKYLSHLFKKNTGINFNAYLTDLRMKHAVRCIEGGMRGIPLIAEACGYYDPVYFTKVFRRVYGESPRAYIKKKEAEGKTP